MKPKRWMLISVWFIFLAVIAGCAPEAGPVPASEPVTITVSAAASLTDAFGEIAMLFEDANPQVSVTLNFASSQELATQILQGASVDIFASANEKQMDMVLTAQKLPRDSAVIFARNELAVIFPAGNPGEILALADLARPGLKLVFAGVETPIGKYSLDFLDLAEQSGGFGAGYKDAVLANVVSYENNVRSVLTKITLGEADGGVVYGTDAGTAQGKVGVLEIPADLNIIAEYPILALPGTQQEEWAQAFVDFVLSPQGQQVLKKYGFIPGQ